MEVYDEAASATTIITSQVQPLADRQGALHRRADRGRGRRIGRDAQRRRRLVEVEYEELDAVIDPYEASKDGAPQLYGKVTNNISVREETVHGDVEAAMANGRDQGQGQDPRAALPSDADGDARPCWPTPDPITRGITFWTSTQAPHWIPQRDRRRASVLSQNQVRAHRAGGRRRFRLQDRRLPRGLRRRRRWRSS